MPSINAYSTLDRLLHHIAFSRPLVQKVLGELESDLFRNRMRGIQSEREVFVTGLPRSGTTLLLELLYGTGEFATFTYRQMPFVLAPLLWDRLSRMFRRKAQARERAHGDGMQVSFDSPEAFEEVIWLTYLRQAFVRDDHLLPLPAEQDLGRGEDALRGVINRLIGLEMSRRGTPLRYLSKNNGNIGRLGLLARLFPGSTILVPFRHPGAHVASLMQQHERFLREHRQDRFSRHYMRWLGHFEFGADFKPVNFDGWLDGRTGSSRPDPGFWLAYWTAAYRHALNSRPENVVFVDFDELLRGGAPALARLAEHLGLQRSEALQASAESLRAPTSTPLDAASCPTAEWQAAQSVHQQLVALAAEPRPATVPLTANPASSRGDAAATADAALL
ncbi:sulfotransferase [Alkalilimnicola sp. S0819]|uniref:sulfotransferase n=1 Tax=Alkalilimnicola sp. S0819 TaxID=2613922 RepID=UPI0012622948|nr:sulfotransferase [Alkalilimnicola sp. S0819]KAB7619689.1 sulfotransferase [Alkalilimnicola sp. S0819]MPQ17546.1 hypothetical protein [Alkalilimnicola sp. S0819]